MNYMPCRAMGTLYGNFIMEYKHADLRNLQGFRWVYLPIGAARDVINDLTITERKLAFVMDFHIQKNHEKKARCWFLTFCVLI